MTPANKLDFANIHVLDGGMATELEKLGCDLSGPLWSALVLREAPEKIEAVHDSYLAAGADCILTSSYQVSAEAFMEIGLSPAQAAEAAAANLRESVRLAVRSRQRFAAHSGRKILIAASLGPYGAALHSGAEYHGNYDLSFEELVDFHVRRIAVVAETHGDLIAFETVPSLDEAGAILAALEQFPEVAAWVSFTCKDELRVAHGEKISDCAILLGSMPQIAAIGVNCTPSHLISGLVRQIKPVTAKPIVVYPNSGEVWNGETRRWSGQSDHGNFAELASEWREAGAQIIGGCCRTGPEHIRAIRAKFA